MPIYDYECRICNNKSEVFQKVSDPDPLVCESCGAENALVKIISQSTFQLKGGGWYRDLYGNQKDSGSNN